MTQQCHDDQEEEFKIFNIKNEVENMYEWVDKGMRSLNLARSNQNTIEINFTYYLRIYQYLYLSQYN